VRCRRLALETPTESPPTESPPTESPPTAARKGAKVGSRGVFPPDLGGGELWKNAAPAPVDVHAKVQESRKCAKAQRPTAVSFARGERLPCKIDRKGSRVRLRTGSNNDPGATSHKRTCPASCQAASGYRAARTSAGSIPPTSSTWPILLGNTNRSRPCWTFLSWAMVSMIAWRSSLGSSTGRPRA